MSVTDKSDQQFLGRGWQFPPKFDKTGLTPGVGMVAAEQDIHQSLVVLFSTAPGERVMLPEYGCALRDHVFDAINSYMLKMLETLITDAVLRYEPRIVLDDVIFDTEGVLDGLLQIRLNYTIRQTNTRSNMVFPFYMAEGTNVRTIA